MLRSIPQLTDIRDRDLIARKVRLRRLEKSKRHESIPANQHVRDIVKKRIKFNYGGRQAIGVKIFFQDLARLALVSGLAVTVIGVGVSIFIWHTNNVSKNIIAQANPIVSVNQPMGVEQSISNTAPATSSPTAPQQSTLNNSPNQIIIPKISVNANIITVGLVDGNQIGTPRNITQTAWYSGSSKPGQAGAAVIDGHVADYAVHGVFYDLNKLSPGDQIQIKLANGVMVNYQVVKTVAYPANAVDMNAILNPVTPDRSGLNLITCTGNVVPGTNAFDERLVVFAQQI